MVKPKVHKLSKVTNHWTVISIIFFAFLTTTLPCQRLEISMKCKFSVHLRRKPIKQLSLCERMIASYPCGNRCYKILTLRSGRLRNLTMQFLTRVKNSVFPETVELQPPYWSTDLTKQPPIENVSLKSAHLTQNIKSCVSRAYLLLYSDQAVKFDPFGNSSNFCWMRP